MSAFVPGLIIGAGFLIVMFFAALVGGPGSFLVGIVLMVLMSVTGLRWLSRHSP